MANRVHVRYYKMKLNEVALERDALENEIVTGRKLYKDLLALVALERN